MTVGGDVITGASGGGGTIIIGGSGGVEYKHLIALGQAANTDLHLSASTWNTNKVYISQIKVVTSSTDWDLFLIQNGNGFAADDASIPMSQIQTNANGDREILVQQDYEDEDSTNTVHLYFRDNSGSNTASFYIEGHKLE